MKLYVFNPDTDMALADNSENYMAPASVRRMVQDLALLPAWYASSGSKVLAPSAYNSDYLKQMQQIFSLPVEVVTEPELPDYADAQIEPWGWNLALRKRLMKGGFPENKLLDHFDIEMYRMLSSRSTIPELYRAFNHYGQGDYICGYVRLLEETDLEPYIEEFFSDLNEGFLLKSLWSSSGKGLYWCRNGLTQTATRWCENEMEKHGGVAIEPIFNKEADLAMEFYSDGEGKVLFTGYSMFETDEKGAYSCNILTSDERIENWVKQYIPLEILISIRGWVQKSLEAVFGDSYIGPLGVDMMICRFNSEHPYLVHPFVEVNLRMTMGSVAHALYDKYVAHGSVGRFAIDKFSSNEALCAQHEKDMADYPLVVENGRVVSGYLSLVPITPKSLFRAYINVEQLEM